MALNTSVVKSAIKWATTLESSKDVKSSRRKFLQTGLKGLAGTVLTGEIGIHGNYYLRNNPETDVRRKFKELYGVELHSFRENIENYPLEFVLMSEALQLHKVLNQGTDFQGLKSITIDSDKFYNRNFAGQIRSFHGLERMGMEMGRHSGNGNIVLQHFLDSHDVFTLHHEYGHFRGDQILKKHPEFEKEWRKFSVDNNGKSLYGKTYSSLVNNGFVSDIAQMKFGEDIAEVFMKFVCYMGKFSSSFFLENNKLNGKLNGKLKLGIKYGLVPEYIDKFILILNCYKDCLNEEVGSFDKFLDESKKFLENYPNSIYLSKVNNFRGDLFSSKLSSEKQSVNFFYENAKESYINSLNSGFKDIRDYNHSLSRLFELNKIYGFTEIADEFKIAKNLFVRSLNDGDILLPINGINDYLRSRKLI